MIALCRCGLPVDVSGEVPDGKPFWYPENDPEPGPEVTAVAMVGRHPAFYYYERDIDGWQIEGLLAGHGEDVTPIAWQDVGACWAGSRHPVVAVEEPPAEPPAESAADRDRSGLR